jgi:hypothetical protein
MAKRKMRAFTKEFDGCVYLEPSDAIMGIPNHRRAG